MKKILVPIDFSTNTINSVKAACDLAEQLNCSIILFHSYFDIAVMQGMSLASNIDTLPIVEPGMADILQQQSEKEMERWVREIRCSHPDIAVQSVVSPVELREKIAEICEEDNVLMIVMSATGTGKKDSFSGSAASGMFDNTPVPIIAIPEGYRYEKDALFKNILYATDFSDVAQEEIQFIIDHFLGHVNKLYCCHLSSFREKDASQPSKEMAVLKSYFPIEERSEKVVFRIIETTDVEDALEELTDDNDIGLISFHEHDRSFFYRFFHRSTIKKNLYRFNVPLLVFRRFERKR